MSGLSPTTDSHTLGRPTRTPSTGRCFSTGPSSRPPRRPSSGEESSRDTPLVTSLLGKGKTVEDEGNPGRTEDFLLVRKICWGSKGSLLSFDRNGRNSGWWWCGRCSCFALGPSSLNRYDPGLRVHLASREEGRVEMRPVRRTTNSLTPQTLSRGSE